MYLSKLKNIFFNFNQGGQEPPFSKLPKIAQKRKQIEKLLNKNSTPLFIVDKNILLERLEELEKALKKHWKNHQIAYSFKTNYEIVNSSIFKNHNIWAEVVSGWEYQMAKKLGFKGRQIIFNGPYKKNEELLTGFKDGALIFIDNFDELNRIKKITPSEKKLLNIGLRINVEIAGMGKSRFGFSVDNNDAKSAINKINSARNLRLVGFHVHIGSDIDSLQAYKQAAKALCCFIKDNVHNYQSSIEFIDFGGGFPASGLKPLHRKKWHPKPVEKYVKAITKELAQLFLNKETLLILEPGRYLADDATIFITKVINKTTSQNRQVLTADAAITMLPLTYYRPQIIKVFSKNLNEKTNPMVDSIVYGSTCKEDDILYKSQLPRAEIGDYLVYYVMGAYNQSMSSNFIFDKPKLYCI